MKQMQDKGESASYDEILSSIIKRDEGDMHRQVGPLRKPYDAHVIDSSTLSPQQVVDVMASIVTSVIRGKSSCES